MASRPSDSLYFVPSCRAVSTFLYLPVPSSAAFPVPFWNFWKVQEGTGSCTGRYRKIQEGTGRYRLLYRKVQEGTGKYRLLYRKVQEYREGTEK